MPADNKSDYLGGGAAFSYVYVAPVPAELGNEKIHPAERQREIEETRNPELKKQKYCVWRLLERAVSEAFGKQLESFEIKKSESGKWLSSGFEFSLSHTDSLVAVAISSAPIGVDVEKIAPVRTASFADKALSISEKQEYCSLPDSEKEEYLIRKWSEKESLFKLSGEKTFHPSEIDTLCERVHSQIIENEGERFVLSVAGGTESIKISRIKSIE